MPRLGGTSRTDGWRPEHTRSLYLQIEKRREQNVVEWNTELSYVDIIDGCMKCNETLLV